MPAEALVFALLGHPVAHSLSPAMHLAALRALGLPHAYVARDVADRRTLVEAVGDVAAGRLAGANVTLPHKPAALELATRVAASALEVGAANVLVREPDGAVVAHNTDAAALALELDALCAERPPERALVLGGGGAALAAVAACARLGARSIVATSRSFLGADPASASPAAARLRALGAAVVAWPVGLRAPFRDARGPFDLVVQATSAGMLGADPGDDVVAAVPWDVVAPNARAYDVVYRPAVTPFLARARAHGLDTRGGLGMLVHQAGLSFALWLGRGAPFEVMRAAAEAALRASEGPA